MRLLFFLILSFNSIGQSNTFFNDADVFFKKYVKNGRVDYGSVKSGKELKLLIHEVETEGIHEEKEFAYLINVYNLIVIDKIINSYPVNSPMDNASFFDEKKSVINGVKISLNELENDIIRKKYKDPRIHFVLVCAGLGCPPITNFAYRPEKLDEQMERQTKLALNNPDFVYEKDGTTQLSEIFSWYTSDFGKNNSEVIDFINKYRKKPFSKENKVRFYPYDWSLNDTKLEVDDILSLDRRAPLSEEQNLQQFNAGSLLGKGKMDITLFNTLYTENKQNWLGQEFTGYRTSFMTHLFQYTIGVTKDRRFNIGLDVSFRSSGRSSDSTFRGVGQAFAYKNNDSSRVGITNIGLRLKFQPFKNVKDFSLQSTLSFPTIKHPEGSNGVNNGGQALFWADWSRTTWWNQFFYTKSFGNKFQLFTELDFLFRFRLNKNQIGMMDIPASVFFSYFPHKKVTIYAMTQHVHRFTNDIDGNLAKGNDWVIPMNYTASGIGLKFLPVSNLTLEFLYTNFWRGRNSGLGSTFNFGIKFITR